MPSSVYQAMLSAPKAARRTVPLGGAESRFLTKNGAAAAEAACFKKERRVP